MAKRRCIVYALPGLTHYETAWRYQRVLAEHTHQQKKASLAGITGAAWPPDHLLLLQHPRIFTLGRGATQENLKFSVDTQGVGRAGEPEVVRVERGGEITWHGPGQMVAYPILDLNNDRPGGAAENAGNAHRKDLHWYTTQLEQTVISLLRAPPFRLRGVGRHAINTGVWVSHDHGRFASFDASTAAVGTNEQQQQHSKISAIGVTASRWITMHGLSLNVCPDMTDYSLIVPCGIQAEQGREEGREARFGVCSMQQLLRSGFGGTAGSGSDSSDNSGNSGPAATVDVPAVQQLYEQAFAAVFNLQLQRPPEGDATQALQELLRQYPAIAAMQLPRSIAKA